MLAERGDDMRQVGGDLRNEARRVEVAFEEVVGADVDGDERHLTFVLVEESDRFIEL